MENTARHPGDPSLKPMLIWSAVFHGALAATMLVSTIISNHNGENWAGSAGGASVTVGLVGSIPAIPLPKPEAITESRVVDESKGLYKEEPKPKEVPPPPTADAIPEFKTEKKPMIVPSKPSKVLETPNVPPPTNAVPYGGGGAPALPYSSTFSQPGSGSQGALGMTGQGGGDFGSKYSWFVDAVRNRISSNWLQSMIDPSVRFAPRATVNFTILRDGTITNIQVVHSSGNSSVDNSAVRAILSSSPVMKLPNDYSGQVVNVEFWFEFKR
jgi:periplasmic protein TonB